MAPKSYEVFEIDSVSSFIQKTEELSAPQNAFYRGQGVDKPLLPAVARELRDIDLSTSEKAFLNEFRRRSSAFCDVSKYNDWGLLALAQHNGAPTRLLDWSRNPLVALWFSVSNLPDKGGASVVWRVDTNSNDFVTETELKTSPFNLRKTKFFQPEHVSPRIVAQEGHFSVHRYWEKGGKYVALENLKGFKGKLTKFVIKKGREELIQAQLDRLGLNFANLFPDFYGLSRHLAIHHKFMIRDLSFNNMINIVSNDIKSQN